jgi:hypothetical protein
MTKAAGRRGESFIVAPVLVLFGGAVRKNARPKAEILGVLILYLTYLGWLGVFSNPFPFQIPRFRLLGRIKIQFGSTE